MHTSLRQLACLLVLFAAPLAYAEEPRPAPPSPAPAAVVAPVPEEPLRPEQYKAPQQLFEELPRFGAGLFASVAAAKPGTVQPVSNQPAPPGYLLGPGDRLALRVWVKDFEQVSQDVTVTPEGFVILDEIGRVPATGLTLEQLRDQLREAYSRAFTKPEVTLTVAEQRTVEVYVTGDAVRPGKYTLAGLATVLGALYAAGGPSDIGSFRRLTVQRVGQEPLTVDLYGYLLTGRRDQDVALRPGDTIFVPTVGGEFGLCGEIRRPARYELQANLTVADALQLAGGLKPSAYAPMVHLWRHDNHAKWRLQTLDLGRADSADLKLPLQDGDLLIVKRILPTGANTVQLLGAVKRPGYYPVTKDTTVSSLLREAEGLMWNAHMGTGVVRRMDYDRHYTVIPFDVSEQMYGENPPRIPLESKDEVEVFAQDTVEPSQNVTVQGAVAHPGVYPWAVNLKVSQLLLLAGGLLPEAFVKRADLLRLNADQKYEVVAVDLGAALKGDAAADVVVGRGSILKVSTLAEAQPAAVVQAAGFVRSPGKLPRREGMKVSDLLFAAGGLKPGAGPEILLLRGRFEGTPQTERLKLEGTPDNYKVTPDALLQDDDSVAVLGRGQFREQADLVTIQGKIKTPGSYALGRTATKDYTVYDLLQEAGGLLEDANPAGIVVYRKRDFYVAQAQSEDLNRILASVNREAAQPPMEVPVEDQTAAFNSLAGQNLRQVIAGPNSAAIILPPRPVKPEDWVSAIPVSGRKLIETQGAEGNVELEPGDTVVVPRLGNTVMVLGAVPRSGAVPFVAGKALPYYLDESGGLREDAASDRMVVIHANGSAEPVKMKAQLEPGDVLVIPTKHIVRLVRTESAWQQWLRTLMSFGLGALAF